MFKEIAVGISLIAAVEAGYGGYRGGRSQRQTVPIEANLYGHNQVWGHSHYEPGDVDRFENHSAEIYGADDLAWGPNGFANPNTESDSVHNWDDQGDAYICHACGGHGCTLCGGYGHEHKGRQFGYHGHGLKTGFGVGHSHAYLGKKPRSSYNKYGHGVGGRYTQRWSNGYGGRYGLGHGERYGIAHRWSQFNGYGKGNPSTKGSVMGYGLGANAQIPIVDDTPDTVGHQYATEKYMEEYGDDYSDDYSDDYGDERRGATVSGEVAFGRKSLTSEVPSTKDYYVEFASPNFAIGYGAAGKKDSLASVGRGHAYRHEYGNGSGNHSPWNGEVWRHDRGLTNYLWRPLKQDRYHTTPGYSNNQLF